MIWFYEAVAAIRGFMELGGNVLWAIMLALFLMWTFILERIWYLYKVHPAKRLAILQEWESRADTTSWYAKQIRDRMISETSVALKDKIGLIKALIAVCPLLGLLGTVSGMITTFNVMNIFGTGNAKAMSGGISEAMITTQFGLVVAIIGIYVSMILTRRARHFETLVGEIGVHIMRKFQL